MAYPLLHSRFLRPNPKLVLHEYLGIAFPGLDQGFSVSGRLFSETGLTEVNFQNLLESNGSDAAVMRINRITLIPKNVGSNTVELYPRRGHFRLIAKCDVKQSELIYHKMEGNRVQYSSTFKFKSMTQCQKVFGKALLQDEIEDLNLVLGLESHLVVSVQ